MRFLWQSGHIEFRCYNNPADPNNKLPPKIREILQYKAAAAVAEDKPRLNKTKITGSLFEKTTLPPLEDLQWYNDSGSTCHFFHSRSAFKPGSLTPCDTRTVMLADKTSVTSTHMGEVIISCQTSKFVHKRYSTYQQFDINWKTCRQWDTVAFPSHKCPFRPRSNHLFYSTRFSWWDIRHVHAVWTNSQRTGMAMSSCSKLKSQETEHSHRHLVHMNIND